MNDVRHLVVGPARHGVVRHALQMADACGHPVIRVAFARDTDAGDLHGARVVHVPFTDRLFGETIEQAVEAMTRLAGLVAEQGAALSVTLHDVPHDDSALQARRARGYAAVVALARGVVVNSAVELAAIGPVGAGVRSLRLIPLPVFPALASVAATSAEAVRPSATPTIGVLGFLYPDRGYEDVLAAAPAGSRLLAIGEPSAGHGSLAGELAAHAARLGVGWESTGFVPDDELAGVLASVDVPVAPNRRVTASGSINTWTAHGRRALVPDSPYTRELQRLRPDAVEVYDPATSDGLADAVRAALHDPASTLLRGAVPGPVPERCGADYREHLAACLPDRAVSVGRGRVVVPGNRWDLLDAASRAPGPAPSISVVIPYFDAQDDLDRLLAALAVQSVAAGQLEVIVADDGSPRRPRLIRDTRLDIAYVRQDDHGFRAAAARNLGARAARGRVLVFLDADMVPEPDFLTRLTRLPAAGPDCVTVGRRRHADLARWRPADIRAWFDGGAGPEPLPEPAWLREHYERTSGLLTGVDARSYRYLISAVLAVDRGFFHEVGGFDETFTRYGGEDWEFAHRAYVAGAVFAHVRDAVAWHNGPDWAGRADDETRRRVKQLETEALAATLPDPVARGGRRFPCRPAVVVRLAAASAAAAAAGLDAPDTARVVDSAVRADCAFWHPDESVVAALGRANLFHGSPPPDVLASAVTVADVAAAADLGALERWADDADRVGEVHAGPVVVRSRRLLNRTARWQPRTEVDLRLLGRHDAVER